MSPKVPNWSWKNPETFSQGIFHGLAVQKGATFGFGSTVFVTSFCKSVIVIDVYECELSKYEIKFFPYSSYVKFLPTLLSLKKEWGA